MLAPDFRVLPDSVDFSGAAVKKDRTSAPVIDLDSLLHLIQRAGQEIGGDVLLLHGEKPAVRKLHREPVDADPRPNRAPALRGQDLLRREIQFRKYIAQKLSDKVSGLRKERPVPRAGGEARAGNPPPCIKNQADIKEIHEFLSSLRKPHAEDHDILNLSIRRFLCQSWKAKKFCTAI